MYWNREKLGISGKRGKMGGPAGPPVLLKFLFSRILYRDKRACHGCLRFYRSKPVYFSKISRGTRLFFSSPILTKPCF